MLVKDANVLLLGVTFKGNCPDRNTKIVDIYHTLEKYTHNIAVYDPWANPAQVKKEYQISLGTRDLDELEGLFDAVILGVAHDEFKNRNIRKLLKNMESGVVYDVRGVLLKEQIDGRL